VEADIMVNQSSSNNKSARIATREKQIQTIDINYAEVRPKCSKNKNIRNTLTRPKQPNCKKNPNDNTSNSKHKKGKKGNQGKQQAKTKRQTRV